MDALITGGGGLLGRHLVAALLDRGDEVRVLALPDEDVGWLDARGVGVHRGDIRDPESLEAPTRGADAIVHLAGMIGVWKPLRDYVEVNVTGTGHVCRAALAADVSRVVHVSSWTVYGMDRGSPRHEDDAVAPFPEPYAISKAGGDELVRRMIAEDGLPAVIVRPGTFFGPGDRLHFGRIAERLRARRAVVVGRGDNALPLVYVDDVVQGLLLGLEHDRATGEAFNITNDEPLTQTQLFDAVAREIGAPAPRLHVPYRALYAAGYAAERLAAATDSSRAPALTRLGVNLFGTDNRHSIDKARRELGYTPRVPLREGVHLAASGDQPAPAHGAWG